MKQGLGTGTTIIVEDLFFNTPVRFKFLKQDATEFRYIKELIQKIALANPNIAIKLISDGKNVFSSNGNGNINDIIYVLYGKDVTENIINVNYEEDGIKVTGVAGNTLISKDNRKCQIFFLNRRNIRNQVLTSSADQAFKASIGIGKYGFFILNIEMPANMYDINVHPTKLDVRFKDESKIYKIVYHAMKNAMLNKEFLGNNEIEQNKQDYINNEFYFLTNHFVDNKSRIIKQDIPEETKILNNNIKQIANINLSRSENKVSSLAENINKNDASDIINKDVNKDNSNVNDTNKEIKNDIGFENESLINRTNARHIDYKYIGILMRTYIMIEIENELYLIDQHAAHERVLYEQIRDNYKKNIQSNSQMMLIPEIINLTHKEMQFVMDNLELIKSYGFDIEPFGENAIKLNGVPDIEYREKTKNVFLDVLDEMLTNERSSTKDVEERFIATVACKAAVKANMDLEPQEVDKLIQRLLNLKNPYTCPHGRPTTIKFDKNEINGNCS